MSRRTIAGLLAIALIAVLGAVAVLVPVPYVTFKPGPTIDVLSEYDGKKIIQVTGRKTYDDDGDLRMVTVYPSGPEDQLGLIELLDAWLDPDVAVLPKDAVYKPEQTRESVRQESAVQMSSSQDDATAAALSALGVRYSTQVAVDTVDEKGASAGVLKKGDVLRDVDGRATTDAATLVEAIQAVAPGKRVRLAITRDGRDQEVAVTTRAAEDDAKKSRINIGIRQSYVFPFKVKVQLPETIGGPSAGMMFALSIYDLLTPGSLTGGEVIAGSGEITPDGVVGPIGGIGQKLAGAQRDGARLFLVAEENCAEAAEAHYDPKKMRLVRVHTLSEAIKGVTAWRKDPSATLPECAS